MGELPEAGPAGGRLEDVLVATKLSVPRERPGAVSRAPLVARARASGRPVVEVNAPAGYGKSTLLAQWAASDPRAVAWVGLEAPDDEPTILLQLLAAALSRAGVVEPGVVEEMSGAGIAVLGRAAPRLAAAVRTSPVDFVLLLDDVHELRASACHDALGLVVAALPEGSQLVMASRAERPDLARLRASGAVTWIGAADLALDVEGARQILSAAHVPVTAESAALVTERTEGWPAGIYLASLVASEQGADAGPLTGDDRYVADYLQREALGQLSPQTQHFLRRTSVLSRLSASLCDAVLDERGAAERLRELEESSLFLVALDRHRGWFRYHALFREFLLAELRRVEPDEEMKLNLRAADWYQANGSPTRALEHLMLTGEHDRCVQLAAQLALPTYQAGQIATVQRWLRDLGDVLVEGYAPLAVAAGRIAVGTGRTAEALHWAAVADAATFDRVPVDGTASFESARAMFRALLCASGPARMLADASVAIDAEPEWSPWRPTATVLGGVAALLLGDPESAVRLLEEAAERGRELGNADVVVVAESELALLDMDADRWDRAVERVGIALAAIDDHRMLDYPTSLVGFVAGARLAAHRGDAAESARQVVRAMRVRPTCGVLLPYLAIGGRLQLARVCAGDDPTAARHLLREADDLLLRRPDMGTLVREAHEARTLLEAAGHDDPTGASPLTPAELRLLPYLQTHLTIREIGERLFVSRNTASSEIGSIYRKLGVSSRGRAVERALEMGLLGQ
ncbi:LuxR C-terminal-related transcriptional regulator [Cellulomonas sp. PhB150]|uniref:helix-turn-helix transcriptional regulator n=1 Tax=Cellulomonas sp. PhB150 TaxID=2485188 RepID=UPI000F4675B4|nr:LuxR C-terminal-related transcriptional regulator [Cellulomonas sp. PhB150]ROS27883.1 LuxR family maltose regulon positive regulatory protein [Cellulomonas sp. PhB150]